RYGVIESFPSDALGASRELALLFKNLATLRTDARLFDAVDELRWNGPRHEFPAFVERLGEAPPLERPSTSKAPRPRSPPRRTRRVLLGGAARSLVRRRDKSTGTDERSNIGIETLKWILRSAKSIKCSRISFVVSSRTS